MAIRFSDELKPGFTGGLIDSQYIKGGLHEFDTWEDVDKMPASVRKKGMLIYVDADNSKNYTYQWDGTEWKPFNSYNRRVAKEADIDPTDTSLYHDGMFVYAEDTKQVFVIRGGEKTNITVDKDVQGIPMLTQTLIDKMTAENKLPEEYVSISDGMELLEQAHEVYRTTGNGTYLDVIFSAIRELQKNVGMLVNTMKYGLNSYLNTDTATSAVYSKYPEVEMEEPLWAIDEDDLSQITSVSIGTNHGLIPKENVNISVNNELSINDKGASWTDTELACSTATDTKELLYMTTTNRNITIKFGDVDNPESFVDVDLSKEGFETNDATKMNVMVIISRVMPLDKDLGLAGVTYSGENYIYVRISDFSTGNDLLVGYINGNMDGISDTKVKLSRRFYFSRIYMESIKAYKLNIYTKTQSFNDDVLPQTATDDGLKFGVSHITIRSVDTSGTAVENAYRFQENELIYAKKQKGLYIIDNGAVVSLASRTSTNNSGETDMYDNAQMLDALKERGLIYEDEKASGVSGGTWSIANLDGVTFINDETKDVYDIKMDPYGELRSTKVVPASKTLATKMSTVKPSLTEKTVRGFVGILNGAENNLAATSDHTIATLSVSDDFKLNADRVKIGAFYAPDASWNHFGCSHCFIELENTSDKDFPLDNCYIHWVHPDSKNQPKVEHLALKGKVPAGGTYLIRGAKKAEFDDANTFIKVKTYDMEWYVDGALADFSYTKDANNTPNYGYGFLITYQQPDIAYNVHVGISNEGSGTQIVGTSKKDAPGIFETYYIDSIYYYKDIKDSSSQPYWTFVPKNGIGVMSNGDNDCIFRNAFELDPAKQAYQALNKYDSSRTRFQSGSDLYYIPVDREYISFPKTDETYPVSKFTPKASFENKNVQTDKSKLDMDKPNMVYCSFGIDMFKTRCFNWISAGVFDEYVFIRKKGEAKFKAFESYTTETADVTQDTSFPRRKEFSYTTNNIIYARMTHRFPADNTLYTSHKCIIDVRDSGNNLSIPETYEYVVGRIDKNGNPDTNHCSDIQTFTIYPNTYKPVIYQTTDQQGFHWVEYQVWAASANEIDKRISADMGVNNANHIIPILVNTGDLTQNGTRVSEWIDYYNAGKVLFSHLEHMAVVGNNDLCNTDYNALGTGDDEGKSNSFYFHVFTCYEVSEDKDSEGNYKYLPIVNDTYVPSLYFFDSKDYRFIMVNSEITAVNCDKWFKLHVMQTVDGKNKTYTTNIYTGWAIDGVASVYDTSFTTIYTMLYNMTDTTKEMVACMHEMPFTVITEENIANGTKAISRSVSGSSLVGSHLNQIDVNDGKSQYWFSRLMEYRHVRLCIGGHKHTYSCTYPIRENYTYTENGVTKSSKVDGPMKMEKTLQNDTVSFKREDAGGTVDTSKLPLITVDRGTATGTTFFPYEKVDAFVANSNANHTDGVIYFMCQATGFKLFSNKELPSIDQKFSMVIPKHTNDGKASSEQRYPMYAIVNLDNTGNKVTIVRLGNIQKTATKLLTPYVYGTAAVSDEYLVHPKEIGVATGGGAEQEVIANGVWLSGTTEEFNYGKWITESSASTVGISTAIVEW